LDKFYSSPDVKQDLLEKKKKVYCRYYLTGGYRAFTNGNYKLAKDFFWKSLTIYPNPLRKDFLIGIFLLLEIALNIKIKVPGYSKRKEEKHFRRQYGDYFVRWN
jgi:hypothetical protein